MQKILWHDSFSVGVAKLDQHHQHLAHLINQLSDCIPCSNQTEKVVDILSALIEYAKYHFRHEEGYLKAHDYPQFEQHRIEHIQFCEVVAETCYGATIGIIGINDLYNYLSLWWTNHILYEDMLYKPFLENKVLLGK
jgi:hemerythrin